MSEQSRDHNASGKGLDPISSEMHEDFFRIISVNPTLIRRERQFVKKSAASSPSLPSSSKARSAIFIFVLLLLLSLLLPHSVGLTTLARAFCTSSSIGTRQVAPSLISSQVATACTLNPNSKLTLSGVNLPSLPTAGVVDLRFIGGTVSTQSMIQITGPSSDVAGAKVPFVVLVSRNTFMNAAALLVDGSFPPNSNITVSFNTFNSNTKCALLTRISSFPVTFVTVIAYADVVPIVLYARAEVNTQYNTISTNSGVTSHSIPFVINAITFHTGSAARIRGNRISTHGLSGASNTWVLLFNSEYDFPYVDGSQTLSLFRYVGPGSWEYDDNYMRSTTENLAISHIGNSPTIVEALNGGTFSFRRNYFYTVPIIQNSIYKGSTGNVGTNFKYYFTDNTIEAYGNANAMSTLGVTFGGSSVVSFSNNTFISAAATTGNNVIINPVVLSGSSVFLIHGNRFLSPAGANLYQNNIAFSAGFSLSGSSLLSVVGNSVDAKNRAPSYAYKLFSMSTAPVIASTARVYVCETRYYGTRAQNQSAFRAVATANFLAMAIEFCAATHSVSMPITETRSPRVSFSRTQGLTLTVSGGPGTPSRSGPYDSSTLSVGGLTASLSLLVSTTASVFNPSRSGTHNEKASGTVTGGALAVSRTSSLVKTQSDTWPQGRGALSRTASTVLTSSLSSAGTNTWSVPRAVSISAMPSDTFGAHSSSSSVVTSTRAPKPPLMLRPIPAVSVVASKVRAVGGVVSVALARGSTGGGQLGVANALTRMASCDEEDNEPEHEDTLPIIVHPLRFSLFSTSGGDGPRGAYTASVVGNAVLIPSGITIFALGVAQLLALTRAVSREEALTNMGWPSLMITPFSTLAEGIGVGIVRSLRGGDGFSVGQEALSVAVGLVGLAVLLSFSGAWVWVLVRLIPRSQMCLLPTRPSPTAAATADLRPSSLSTNLRDIGKRARRAVLNVPDTMSEESLLDLDIPLVRGEDGGREHHDCGESKPTLGLCGRFLHLSLSPVDCLHPMWQWAPLEADDAVRTNAMEASVPTKVRPISSRNMQRYGNAVGDKRLFYAEIISFGCSIIVGIAEGLPPRLCKPRIVVALLAAVVQCACSLTTVVPAELLLQAVLSCLIIPLSVVATVKVFEDETAGSGVRDSANNRSDASALVLYSDEDAVNHESVLYVAESALDYLSIATNILGMLLMVVGLLRSSWKMFRRRQKEAALMSATSVPPPQGVMEEDHALESLGAGGGGQLLQTPPANDACDVYSNDSRDNLSSATAIRLVTATTDEEAPTPLLAEAEPGNPHRSPPAGDRLKSPHTTLTTTITTTTTTTAGDCDDDDGPLPPGFENFKGPKWQARMLFRVEEAERRKLRGLNFM